MSEGPSGTSKFTVISSKLVGRAPQSHPAAVLHEHRDLRREADCFLLFIPQHPVKALPQHLHCQGKGDFCGISLSSVKSPASTPMQGKDQSVVQGVFGQGPVNRACCAPYLRTIPNYLSWKFLAAHISNPGLFSFPSLKRQSTLLDLASHNQGNQRSSPQLQLRLYIYFLFLPFLHCRVTCQNEEVVTQSV